MNPDPAELSAQRDLPDEIIVSRSLLLALLAEAEGVAAEATQRAQALRGILGIAAVGSPEKVSESAAGVPAVTVDVAPSDELLKGFEGLGARGELLTEIAARVTPHRDALTDCLALKAKPVKRRPACPSPRVDAAAYEKYVKTYEATVKWDEAGKDSGVAYELGYLPAERSTDSSAKPAELLWASMSVTQVEAKDGRGKVKQRSGTTVRLDFSEGNLSSLKTSAYVETRHGPDYDDLRRETGEMSMTISSDVIVITCDGEQRRDMRGRWQWYPPGELSEGVLRFDEADGGVFKVMSADGRRANGEYKDVSTKTILQDLDETLAVLPTNR